MRGRFYMWFCFCFSAAMIIGMWAFVLPNTLAHTASAKKSNPKVDETIAELEKTLQGFQELQGQRLEVSKKQMRAAVQNSIALQRLKEKLQQTTSTHYERP